MQKFKDEKALQKAILSQESWPSDRLFEYGVDIDGHATKFLLAMAKSKGKSSEEFKRAFSVNMRGYYTYQKGFHLQEEQKKLVELSGKVIHILEFFGRSSDELLSVYNPDEMSKSIASLLYEYFTWLNDFDSAEKVLDKFYQSKKADNEKVKFIIYSDRSNDFIPALRYGMKKTKSVIGKETFSNYAVALKAKPKSYKNETNTEEYRKFIKFYKKEFSNVTSYSGADRYNGNAKNIKIKFFDLVESDFAARDKVFTMKTWDDITIFDSLLRENPAKLRQLVIDYFNKQHIDGKNPRRFVKTYRQIKEKFDNSKIEFIDVFQLNVKLQSLILMEML